MDADRGQALLDQLQDGETQRQWRGLLGRRAPGLADWVVEAVFGGTYQRGELSLRDRQLLILGALTAFGGVDPQLSGHLRTSLRIGLSQEDLAECFAHLVPYVGLPKALAGLRLLDAVPDAVLDAVPDASVSAGPT
jgi:4-carboxymuconolactone decarboxylase